MSGPSDRSIEAETIFSQGATAMGKGDNRQRDDKKSKKKPKQGAKKGPSK